MEVTHADDLETFAWIGCCLVVCFAGPASSLLACANTRIDPPIGNGN